MMNKMCMAAIIAASLYAGTTLDYFCPTCRRKENH